MQHHPGILALIGGEQTGQGAFDSRVDGPTPTMRNPPAIVGDSLSFDITDYIQEVREEINALDSDIGAAIKPGGTLPIGQGFLGEWTEFLIRWRAFLGGINLGGKVFNTGAMFDTVSAFENETIGWYQKYMALGGTPSHPMPKAGFVPKKDGATGTLKTVLIVGAVLGGLYMLWGIAHEGHQTVALVKE